jgi:hypothetical protein
MISLNEKFIQVTDAYRSTIQDPHFSHTQKMEIAKKCDAFFRDHPEYFDVWRLLLRSDPYFFVRPRL